MVEGQLVSYDSCIFCSLFSLKMSKAPPPTAPVSPSTIPAAPPSSGPFYGFTTPYPSQPFQNQPPPTYAQAVGGVPPAAPFTPQQQSLRQQHIITTVVPLGLNPTHMICPHCQKEMETKVQRSPKVGAYLAGLLICLMG